MTHPWHGEDRQIDYSPSPKYNMRFQTNKSRYYLKLAYKMLQICKIYIHVDSEGKIDKMTEERSTGGYNIHGCCIQHLKTAKDWESVRKSIIRPVPFMYFSKHLLIGSSGCGTLNCRNLMVLNHKNASFFQAKQVTSDDL